MNSVSMMNSYMTGMQPISTLPAGYPAPSPKALSAPAPPSVPAPHSIAAPAWPAYMMTDDPTDLAMYLSDSRASSRSSFESAGSRSSFESSAGGTQSLFQRLFAF